jgi:hypothetical protein
MENNTTEKVQQSIENLRNKTSKIYFLVQDTKNNAKASVRFIYEMAYAIKQNGFNPIMLHEKKDYTSVSEWLDDKYMTELPHQAIEGENLQIAPEDFIVLPEIFGFVMEQIKNLPCGKIVLAQSYRYILETLQPGQSWAQFGFFKCITTSEKQKEYIERVMKQTSYDIVSPTISSYFEPRALPPMPIIAVHTKEQTDTVNLIKTFYLKFPQYRWFTFKDMRGLSEKEFAETLKECFLSVWIDDDSAFGTFPLESMSCGVPVMARIPNIQPEWMTENNGLWVTDKTLMPDFVADFIQNWLEDNIKPELYEEGFKTAEKYKNKQEFESNVVTLFEGYLKTRADSFESQISKTQA